MTECFLSFFFFSFISKPFSNAVSNLFEIFSVFNKTTHHNKLNAMACMLKHVARTYDNFNVKEKKNISLYFYEHKNT